MYSDDYSELYDILESGSNSTSVVWNLISFALWVLLIVAQWRIYEKAGERGWAALIPYYRDYILYKISGKKKLFVWYLICSIVCVVSCMVFFVALVVLFFEAMTGYSYLTGSAYDNGKIAMYGMLVVITLLIMAVTGIAIFVFRILQCIGLSKNFGQGGGFAVGLIFLPTIFYCILAFGRSYVYQSFSASYAGGSYGYGGPDGNPPYGNPNGYMDPQYGNPNGYGNQQYGNPNGYGNQQYGNPNGYGNQPYNNPTNYGNQQYGNPAGYDNQSYADSTGYGNLQSQSPAEYGESRDTDSQL